MNRRKFLTTAAATTTTIAVAGCTVGDQSPPPRRSNVFEGLSTEEGTLRANLASNPTVKSRAQVHETPIEEEINEQLSNAGSFLASLSPVGVAAAKGRGVAGRGVSSGGSAPRGTHGWYIYYGGDYADGWYEEHEKEVKEYPVNIVEAGVGRLGQLEAEEKTLPVPGPVEWEEVYNSPNDSFTYDIPRQGWYRVGLHMVAANADYNFGWAAVDFQLEQEGGEYRISNQWKVSPRI